MLALSTPTCTHFELSIVVENQFKSKSNGTLVLIKSDSYLCCVDRLGTTQLRTKEDSAIDSLGDKNLATG